MNRLPVCADPPVRLWLCALAAGCLAAGAAVAADLSPEERLQAVRHGLTQQAMQGATQVHTTAWIDEQGALRETSSFRTGMQVRGVRVIAYSRDGQGQPQAQLQVQSPQDLLKGQPGAGPLAAAAQCRQPDQLRHVLGLHLQARGAWPVDEEHLRRDAAQTLLRGWLAAAAAAPRWQLLDLPPVSAGAAALSSSAAYERLLTGGPSTSPILPWRLQVAMELVPVPGPKIHLPWAVGSPLMRLSLSLQSPSENKPVVQSVLELPLQAQDRSWSAPRLHPEVHQRLQVLVQTWAQAVSQRLACEPVQVQVLQAQGDRVQIDQGALAGVRAGDEWLVSDRRRWPARMLEPGAASGLVLARVEQVSEHRAQLQVLAGPTAAVRPNWQAWPMDKR
jgi:hypothetical protein